MNIPTLVTDRLTLRPPVIADFPQYAALMGSQRSIHMGGPFNLKASWGSFCHDVALWELYGHGALMVDVTATGTCVGQVGINHGPNFPEKELGWLLYEGHEGQGYATEAGRVLLDWAFTTHGLQTLVSYFDPENHRSMAVSRRLGGVPDPDAVRQDPGDEVYRYRR